jgi:hypothetical protein
MKPEPAYEITPQHKIQVPFFAESGKKIPSDVTKANANANKQINDAKDQFVMACLELIIPENEIGEIELEHLGDPSAKFAAMIGKIDPAQLQLTLRNDYAPFIVLPSENAPESERQKGFTRQTGHTLNMSYAGHWLGTMQIDYGYDGQIHIDITTKTP